MEIVDVYDAKKKKTNKTVERKEKPREGEYRLSIQIWITNEKGEILIQKRSSNRTMFPNMWSETAGGAAQAGESSEETCAREFREELGVAPDMNNAEYIGCMKRKYDYVDIWYIKQNVDLKSIKVQVEEVSEVKYASIEEIKKLIDDKKFVPTVVPSLKLFLNYLKIINN